MVVTKAANILGCRQGRDRAFVFHLYIIRPACLSRSVKQQMLHALR